MLDKHVQELCRLASQEKDPDKLLALVREINQAMGSKAQQKKTEDGSVLDQRGKPPSV